MSVINNVTDCFWADISYFQKPVDDSYLDAGYRVLSIRSSDGTFRDPNFAHNYQWCVDRCNAGRLDLFVVYFYWRIGPGDVDAHMDMVRAAGGPHPKMVVMIDLESGGNPSGNQSQELNAEYQRLVTWLGDPRRVIAYANIGDARAMWPQHPGNLKWIIAGYGANPSDTNYSKIGHQYTDGRGYGGGLPEGAPPFGPCDMNVADGFSVGALANSLGVGTPPPTSPPPSPPPVTVPSDWQLPNDDSLFAAADAIIGQFQ